MKLLRTKWASLTLVLAMLISLLPPLTAYAAATITVTNLYSPAPGVTPDDNYIDKFTLNPITVDFLINGIADDQISSIYYEIYNANTNLNSINLTNKPIKSTSNNSQVSFQNVQLTPGKNIITIKFGQAGTIASSPAYAFYTPVSNISNLKIAGVDFIDGGMYPKSAPYTGVTITGTSANATEVEADNAANVYQPSAFTNGDFTFVANTGRNTDLSFRPGDNIVTFSAKNLTNFYTANRSFVFDNGQAFAYNAKIDFKGATPSQKLVNSPTLTAPAPAAPATTTISDVQLSANIKNPLTSSAVPRYVQADVFTTGMGSTKLHFDIAPNGTVTTTVYGTLNDGTTPTASLTLTGSTSTDYTFSFTGQLPINPNSSFQEANFQFTDINGAVTNSKYNYSYVDSQKPYIDHVAIVRSSGASTSPSTLSEAGTTQITEFPAAISVYTDANTDEVEIQIGGVQYINGATGTSNRFKVISQVANINLQGLQDGPVIMKVIPYKSLGSNTPGTKQYNLVISSSPYVIVNNIFNGIVVDTSDKLTCVSGGAGPCIQGRIVNLPTTEYPNVVYTLNDIVINNPTVTAATGVFQITDFTPKAGGATIFQRDGKYTLKIALKLNGQVVTTSTTDIFILTNNVPIINYLKPVELDPLNPQFTAGSLPDTFVTRAAQVQLSGEVVNSSITTTPSTVPGTALYLRKAATTPVSGTQLIPLNALTSVPPLQDFTMSAYNLPEYGDYVFELVSANSSAGSTANKIITITREPVPYIFVNPKPNQIIKNSKGIDQTNINQNYFMLELQADKADSVVFGKDKALMDKVTGHFFYEAKNLKVGANDIKFTVNRGTGKTTGEIILFNTSTDIEGEQYKTSLSATMKIFNGDVQLKFPKDTKLMRNDRTNTTQYITIDRQLLFGIANNDDGRVDKPNESLIGTNYLLEPTGHFRPAGKRYWIDAGIISQTANTTNPGLQDAFLGTGILPNTTNALQSPFYIRNYNDLVVPTTRGTITLKYDSNIRDDAAKYLTVYQFGYFNNPTGLGPALASWKNLGGVVDTKSNTITVPIDSFGYFQVMSMDDSFSDVTNHPWARNDLDTLYAKGIMNPKTPGQFMPNDAISRGEFITMLVNIFDIPLINQDTAQSNSGSYNSSTFIDVQRGFGSPGSNGLYDFLHIEAGARAGIVRGNSNGTFLPNSAITRQDAAVMIARAADLKLTTDETKSLAKLQKLFTDANNIDFYAVQSVEAVTNAGLIEGKENILLQGQKKTTLRFDPLENFTRAEAAVVAVRVLKQQKKLPK